MVLTCRTKNCAFEYSQTRTRVFCLFLCFCFVFLKFLIHYGLTDTFVKHNKDKLLEKSSGGLGVVRLENIFLDDQESASERRTLFSFCESLDASLKPKGMTSQQNKVAKTYSTKMSSHGYIFCKLQRLEYKSE